MLNLSIILPATSITAAAINNGAATAVNAVAAIPAAASSTTSVIKSKSYFHLFSPFYH